MKAQQRLKTPLAITLCSSRSSNKKQLFCVRLCDNNFRRQTDQYESCRFDVSSWVNNHCAEDGPLPVVADRFETDEVVDWKDLYPLQEGQKQHSCHINLLI